MRLRQPCRQATIGWLLALLVLSGCSMLAGSPASTSSWRSETEKALGSDLSSLGTAQVLLEYQERGSLPQPYVEVAMRDVQRTLDTETASYRSLQPPLSRAHDHAAAVAAINEVATLLSSAASTSSAVDRTARARALAAVKAEYDAVERLQKRLAG